ncbi:uncharacterized protein IWZ02DRAFT_219053 [Phyllosticta citriasiana]|uniref:uncharacterized protein n=1 Tax=Phyllosticta citriasiana TaxID=595635 RepID=UPI0030FD937C
MLHADNFESSYSLWALTVCCSLQSSLSMATVRKIIMHTHHFQICLLSSRLYLQSRIHSLAPIPHVCMHVEKSSMSILFHASRSPFQSTPPTRQMHRSIVGCLIVLRFDVDTYLATCIEEPRHASQCSAPIHPFFHPAHRACEKINQPPNQPTKTSSQSLMHVPPPPSPSPSPLGCVCPFPPPYTTQPTCVLRTCPTYLSFLSCLSVEY